MSDAESGSMVPSNEMNEFFRFSIVGVLNVAISFVVFYFSYNYCPCTEYAYLLKGLMPEYFFNPENENIVSLDAAISNVIGYIVGMINSFLLNKYWTFKVEGPTGTQLWRFLIVNLIGLGFSSCALYVFVDRMKLPYVYIWVLTTGVVMVFNFLANKLWTFSSNPMPEVGSR